MMRKPRIFSLCCGAGVGELGFKRHFETVLAVDSWYRACLSFTANFPDTTVTHANAADEKLIQWAGSLGPIDGIISTAPCPSFSVANSRGAISDPRSLVYLDCVKWVEALRPSFYLAENVDSIKGSPCLGMAIAKLQRLGYRTVCWVCDAADFGAPQHRARLFLVATRHGPPPKPPVPTHGNGPGLLPYATVGDAIGRLSEEDALSMGCESLPPRRSWVMEAVPAGGDWKSLKGERRDYALQYGRNSPTRFSSDGTGLHPREFARMPIDRPAPTIGTMPQSNRTPAHPGRKSGDGTRTRAKPITRPLSVIEFLRLQGVNVPFALFGSRSDRYALAGNGVPVQLAEAIGGVVARVLRGPGLNS